MTSNHLLHRIAHVFYDKQSDGYRLRAKCRFKLTASWSQAKWVTSSKSFPDTYGTEEAAEADMPRFKAWLEGGAMERKRKPFERESKRNSTEVAGNSAVADLPPHYFAANGGAILDARLIHLARPEGEEKSPEPKDVHLGSKKSRDGTYKELVGLDRISFKRKAVQDLRSQLKSTDAVVDFLRTHTIEQVMRKIKKM